MIRGMVGRVGEVVGVGVPMQPVVLHEVPRAASQLARGQLSQPMPSPSRSTTPTREPGWPAQDQGARPAALPVSRILEWTVVRQDWGCKCGDGCGCGCHRQGAGERVAPLHFGRRLGTGGGGSRRVSRTGRWLCPVRSWSGQLEHRSRGCGAAAAGLPIGVVAVVGGMMVTVPLLRRN